MNLDFNIDLGLDDLLREVRIHNPRDDHGFPDFKINYDNAVDLAKSINIIDKINAYCVVPGNFIFGDMIEALVVEHDLDIQRMDISTLSMSEENVDSLCNITSGGYCNELNLLVSSYFYAHERSKLIPYIYNNLDGDHNKFQLAVCGNHTKVVIIKLTDGTSITIHGSANLRSSDCLEQFALEFSHDLYDFNLRFIDLILKKYSTIKKEIRGKTLWQVVKQNQDQANQDQAKQKTEARKRRKNNSWEV